jgi:hypothetical protein
MEQGQTHQNLIFIDRLFRQVEMYFFYSLCRELGINREKFLMRLHFQSASIP